MMSSTRMFLPKTQEVSVCQPHYHCQMDNRLIGSLIFLLPVIRITNIFAFYVRTKKTEVRKPNLKPKKDDSSEEKLLIQSIMCTILDSVFKEKEFETLLDLTVSDSNRVEEPSLSLIDMSHPQHEVDNTEESRSILDYIVNLVFKKLEHNWIKYYCTSLFDNILQNISEVLPISIIWPDFFHSYVNNTHFLPEEINLSSVFEDRYNLSTNFFKTKKILTKKTNKETPKIKKEIIPQIDIKLKHSIIDKLPLMEKLKKFKCESIPKHSIIVDIDEFSSCETNDVQTEKSKKVIYMKYTFQKVIQTKLDQNYVAVETQTETYEKVNIENGKLAIWCQLLVDSMIMVLPVEKFQHEPIAITSEISLNTQLNARILYSSENSVSSILSLIEIILAECTYYEKTFNTCSCKFYIKKHYFLSLVLNIFYIITKFLTLISYYQKKNLLKFAYQSKCEPTFLRCCSTLLNFYDDNEIMWTDNFEQFDDFSKIQHNLFSFILNLSYSMNHSIKKSNVIIIYKKLIQKILNKYLKIQLLLK